MSNKEIIAWIDASKELPDDNITVLLFLKEASEPVWTVHHEDNNWHYSEGYVIRSGSVTHWAHMPSGPENSK
jgi:hypothetical protein